jgi:hypothetical protein
MKDSVINSIIPSRQNTHIKMCMKNAWHNFSPKILRTVFLFNWDVENVSEYSILRN